MGRARELYDGCCSKNITLSEGKLYPCAFAANLARLGIYNGHDVVGACTFCSGRPFNDNLIKGAVQIPECRPIGS